MSEFDQPCVYGPPPPDYYSQKTIVKPKRKISVTFVICAIIAIFIIATAILFLCL